MYPLFPVCVFEVLFPFCCPRVASWISCWCSLPCSRDECSVSTSTCSACVIISFGLAQIYFLCSSSRFCSLKVLLQSGNWLVGVPFLCTWLHSGLFRRWFVFPIGVLKGIFQLGHVYFRRCSSSSASSCLYIRVGYSGISSANCFCFLC